MTKQEALDIAEEISAFRRSADCFSEEKPNLIEKFADQWVAILDGKVVANAQTIGDLIDALERNQQSPHRAMIRYLSSERRKFIL